ncbi:hypothetical protein INT43_009122 [Umbelopsis isabellina]|uniref:YbaK/aminoacyl-tRNA synthetase-associated domain-containing protein n=1 Tax=Mortierella isabellina TaxID=91625 RepID=A0A8H7PCP2_MORIS|nr:hypothetical protein INT43_009122 [Umbelopsis isabellina]
MLVSDLDPKLQDAIETLAGDVNSLLAQSCWQDIHNKRFKSKAKSESLSADAPERVHHVQKACQATGLAEMCRYFKVEPDYYDWSLERRAYTLRTSVASLCKSVVFENTRCEHNNFTDPLNSKYYCVITQYIAPINTAKMVDSVRELSNNAISKKKYNFRLTSPENSLALTGFDNNGVSPIGMKENIPIILSKAVTELKPAIMFLGAGDVDWKIAVPIEQFIKQTHCLVMDLS